MDIIRKAFGFFILAFFAVPTLMLSLWMAGTINGVTNIGFFDNARKVTVQKAPTILDEALQKTQTSNIIKDPNGRIWLAALHKTGKKPSQILKDVGLSEWLDMELGQFFKGIHQLSNGKVPPQGLYFDTTRLKNALKSKNFRDLLQEVFQNLPSCKAVGKKMWDHSLKPKRRKDRYNDPPPSCNPGFEITDELISQMMVSIVDISSKVPVASPRELKEAARAIKTVHSTFWFSFLLPLGLLFLGSLAAGPNLASFCRWFGGSIAVTGLLIHLTIKSLQSLILQLLEHERSVMDIFAHPEVWFPEVDEWVVSKLIPIASEITQPIFQSIGSLGTSTLILGVLIMGASFILDTKERSNPSNPSGYMG